MEEEKRNYIYCVLVEGRDIRSLQYYFSTLEKAQEFFTKLAKKAFEIAGVNDDDYQRDLERCILEREVLMGLYLKINLEQFELNKTENDETIHKIIMEGL